ncbi:adhesion G protein-coupled receptor B2 [Trichonephila clavipes]|uniref:Adhesion G protein-coupled receptor B2 n=1 Tax=Trichonephila clavipes TaxID=2585209 RepID=A0A8X6SH36_TRICX|nr:adhesion G protein-coupled receptor B2 [Trichonephila clavipes]
MYFDDGFILAFDWKNVNNENLYETMIKSGSKDNLVALHFKYDVWHRTATAGSDVVQSGRPIFDDFFQHLWPYIGNNTANVVFQMVKRLWLIRIDQ